MPQPTIAAAVNHSGTVPPLLGLVLGVGLVADDAIVVVEAIEGKIEDGRSPRAAALEAMDEVSGALMGIALPSARRSRRQRVCSRPS